MQALPRTVGGPRDKFETRSALYIRTPRLDILHRIGQQMKDRGSGQVPAPRRGNPRGGLQGLAARRGNPSGVSMRRAPGSLLAEEVHPSPAAKASTSTSSSSSDESIVDVTTTLSPPAPSTVMNGSSQQQLDCPGADMAMLLMSQFIIRQKYAHFAYCT